MKEHADAELVRESLSGNQRAFEVLVRKYEKPIFNLALRMLKDRDDAADVAQSVFVKAYQKLDSFDETHEFFSWIYRIAINESINFKKRTKRLDEYESGVTAALKPTQEEAHGAEVLRDEVIDAIEMLTMDYQIVIVLRHFHDFSYEEMAEVLECPVSTVKSRLYTALDLLKAELAPVRPRGVS